MTYTGIVFKDHFCLSFPVFYMVKQYYSPMPEKSNTERKVGKTKSLADCLDSTLLKMRFIIWSSLEHVTIFR